MEWFIADVNQSPVACHPGARSRPEDLLRNQRKLKYRRPDVTEGIHTIPEYVDVTHGYNATTLINIQERQQDFEQSVCDVIRIPRIFFRGDSINTSSKSGSSSGGPRSMNEDQLNFFRTELDKELVCVQATMSRIYRQIYDTTYHHIDLIELAALYETKEKEELAASKRAVAIADDDDDDEVTTSDVVAMIVADTSPSPNEKARNSLSSINIQLHFERPIVISSTVIPTLLQCVAAGVIDPAYVKQFVYLSFGKKKDLTSQ